MAKITIRAEYFALLAPFTSDEASRYYLSGVGVTRARHGLPGAELAATNGHRLGVFYDEEAIMEAAFAPGFASTIIRATPELVKACKPAKRDNCPRWLVVDLETKVASVVETAEPAEASSITIMQNDWFHGQFGNVLIDGTFPDWQRVVPEEPTEAAHFGANADYLGAFAKIGAEKKSAVAVFAGHKDKPMIIRVLSRPEFFGVLMPLRHSYDAALPGWHTGINLPKPKKAKKPETTAEAAD